MKKLDSVEWFLVIIFVIYIAFQIRGLNDQIGQLKIVAEKCWYEIYDGEYYKN